MNAGRIPEAAFMARTYLPSAVGRLVALWKKDLAKVSTKVSKSDSALDVFFTSGYCFFSRVYTLVSTREDFSVLLAEVVR